MKLYNIMPILLVIGVVLVSGCTQYGTEPAETDPVATTPAATEPAPSQPVGAVKEFDLTAKQWEFNPSTITVNKGDTVKLHITSIDVTHGFGMPDFGISETLTPGSTIDIEFVADKRGTFTFACIVVCGSGHGGMNGQLIVN